MFSKISKFLSVIVSLGILGGFILLIFFVYVSFDLPQISKLSDYNPPIPSKIYSADGELLLEAGEQKREVVEFAKIPPKIVSAFLAAEDDNFYEHKGIDYTGLARAMLKNIMAGGYVQGGSTITQQVAKSLLLSGEKTISRKIKDFLLAQKIEKKFTKEEILFLYLNQVYLGGGYYGIKEATKGYFNKELEDVTVAESALIAGLLVAPGRYSPYINPKMAKDRQLYVLFRMHKTGKITLEEYEAAKKEPIKMRYKRGSSFKGGHFTDWIRHQMIERFGEQEFLNGGYSIKTSLNWQLQKKAEEEILLGVKETDKRQGFKGPIKNLQIQEWNKQFQDQRKKLFINKSHYFVFDTDGSNKDEFYLKEEKILEDLEKKQKELSSADTSNKWNVGFGSIEDPKSDEIFKNLNIEAVVTNVNEKQQIIYANHGGFSIVIPYDGYKWAHQRQISEEAVYFPFVKNPSEIVKVGDVILVNIKDPIKNLFSLMNKDAVASLEKDNKFKEFLKNQKYYLADLDQYPDVEGALLSLDPHTGYVISMVGGSNFEKSQFNRAIQSNRQPGSSFKPFIFASALENGFNAATVLLDSPAALGGVNDSLDWKPRNYDGNFMGEMTFRKSLEVSRNIPTIKIVQEVGVDKVIKFAKRIGIDSELPNDLSISLGSFGISLKKLVEAYSIFPNFGKIVQSKAVLEIKDRFGKNIEVEIKKEPKIEEITPKEKETSLVVENETKEANDFLTSLNETQVYDRRLAYVMINLLKGVVQNGTAKAAREVSPYIAGKTGTTNNYVDSLFVGFSKNVVTGVWFGFDDNKTLGFGETGSKNALPVFSEFMKIAIKKYGEEDFEVPNGIVNVYINKNTGKLSSHNSEAILEAFAQGTEPGNEEEIPSGSDKTDQDTQIIDDDEYYSNQ